MPAAGAAADDALRISYAAGRCLAGIGDCISFIEAATAAAAEQEMGEKEGST